ncbi:MAG TPA: FAD:protein FMN transferase [Clostridia bacterium]|nr:FAD:protein FMN transferase [Clostridia bacterium]
MRKKFFSTLLIIVILFIQLLSSTGCSKTTHIFAFGTECNIYSANTSEIKIKDVKKYIANIDALLSQIETASDLYKINSAKAFEVVSVNKITFDLLSLTKELYEYNHNFNPAIYPLVELWHFDPKTYISGVSPEKIPTDSEIETTLQYCNFDYFELNPEELTVSKTISEAKIDLGAIAKGFVCNEIFEQLKSDKTAVVDIGGTLKTNKDIEVNILNPIKDSDEPFAAKLKLSAGLATATSGDYHRFYYVNGTKYHHVINQDGYPAWHNDIDPIISVTIIGESATICDYLSTLIFILGDSEEAKLLLNNFGYSAIIFRKNTCSLIGDINNFMIIDNRYTLTN